MNIEHKNILTELCILLKQAKFHNANNAAVVASIADFLNSINPIIKAEGILKINLVGDVFYVNNKLIKYSKESYDIIDNITIEFKKLDIGTLSFTENLSVDNMKVFIEAFNNSTDFESISDTFHTINGIEVDGLQHTNDNNDAGTDKRKTIIKTYFNAVYFTKGLISNSDSGKKTSTRNAKRIVSSLANMILDEEPFLMSLTGIKNFDEYTFHHCVNVSILSMTMGQKIGFNRKELLELGFAALFHDFGKKYISEEILNKPGAFTEDEWDIMRKHAYLGTIAILKMKKPDKSLIRNAIVALEHHMNNDLSGYPKLRSAKEIDFYSKIVTIADNYDAITASRVYSRTPFPPDKALSIMMEKSDHFDPHLLRLFINMVGVFPVGTLVYLDSGEMGIVSKNESSELDRPQVVIIINASGKKVDDCVVNLNEKHSSGKYVKSIVKTLDPNKYGINLAEYLL